MALIRRTVSRLRPGVIASSSSLASTTPPVQRERRRPALELFYDGGCNLCRYEIKHCQAWDAGRDAIVFRDITDPTFNAMVAAGTTPKQLRRFIHARVLTLGDPKTGEVVRGVEVFRRLYFHLGRDPEYAPPAPHLVPRILSYVFAATRVPIISQLADLMYAVWARWRIWRRNRTLDRQEEEEAEESLETTQSTVSSASMSTSATSSASPSSTSAGSSTDKACNNAQSCRL